MRVRPTAAAGRAGQVAMWMLNGIDAAGWVKPAWEAGGWGEVVQGMVQLVRGVGHEHSPREGIIAPDHDLGERSVRSAAGAEAGEA